MTTRKTFNHPEESHRAERGHAFYPPAETVAKIPRLYGTEKVSSREKIIHLHYFVGACDWWLVELDPIEWLAFGYACLGDPSGAEWGYVSLPELESVYRPGGGELVGGQVWLVPPLVVERDLHWVPRRAEDACLPGSPG